MMKSYMKKLLVFMLLLVGGFTSEAWAGNVIYHIVNKSGLTPVYEICAHDNEGEALLIPNALKSPYIQDGGYRYFTTAEAAQKYILTREITAEVTTYSSDITNVYVGYDYDPTYTPEGMPKLDTSTDTIRYHIQFGGNRFMFLEYKTNNDYHINPKVEEGSDKVVKDTASVIMQFMFVSDNIDPYDIKIVTPFRPDGWMHSSSSYNTSSNDARDKFRFDKPDPNTTYTQEHFFFTKNGNDLALNVVYEPSEESENVRLPYLTTYGNTMIIDKTAFKNINNNQRIALFPLSLFHIVKKDGSIGISAYSNHKTISEGIPSSIKSPVLKEDQYRYFRTQEAARNYTDTQEIDPKQHLDKNTEITPGQVIYVGYNFKNDTTVVDLSGTRWYHIRGDYGSDKLYFSKETKDGNQSRPGLIAYTKENLESTFAKNYDYTMFRFEGNDPYDIVVRNGFQEYPRYVFSNGSGAKHQLRVTDKDQDPKAVHLMLLPHVNGYHTLATFVDENSPNRIGHGADQYAGTKEDPGYLKMWCKQGNEAYMSSYNIPNGSPNVAGATTAPQPSYFSLESYAQLTFEPVQYKMTFHIIDKKGREAIKYTGLFDAEMPLNYESLPKAIRSPYLEKETLTFYSKVREIGSDNGRPTYAFDEADKIMHAPFLNRDEEGKVVDIDIYVTYTTDHLEENPIPLGDDIIDCNVLVNGNNYVYADGDDVKSNNEAGENNSYIWQIIGKDPYAIQFRNLNAGKVLTYGNPSGDSNLTVSDDSAAGTYFILMSGKEAGKYELMAATGSDAAEERYNIGYTADGVKLYKNKEQGTDEIQVQMKPAVYPTYHLIDKQGIEVLSYTVTPENAEFRLRLPASITSPLVTKYHYWAELSARTELTSISGHSDIYVTYDVDDAMLSTAAEIATSNRTMYRLKFSDTSYLYATETIPGLNLLGNEQFKAHTESSAIERTNWGWYFESNYKDPYHVKVTSAAETQGNARLYLRSTQRGNSEIATDAAFGESTEYMLLGTSGAYQLVAAFDGQLYTVKSFEANNVDGTFEIEKLILQPTLILLDRHGWEIMRKPLPAPDGEENVTACDATAISAYNSPMVSAYKFYRGAQKTVGYHKFEVKESDRIAKTASLTGLPTSSYAMGDNIYATYDVKEEYEKYYSGIPDANGNTVASKYLVHIGDSYVQADDDGNTISYIENTAIESDNFKGVTEKMLWYVKPNAAIDKEMGYTDDPINYDASRKGFDPYNLQIQNSAKATYFTTNATGASVDATASMAATYSGDNMSVTLTDLSTPVTGTGQGGVTLQMTNATFMAVQDENGNMRLMPRFDHSHRLQKGGEGNSIILAEPADAAPANDRSAAQTILLHRLVRYTYIIVDNSGHEALRYRGLVGEEVPQVLPQFQSPMAKDFKFYIGLEAKNRAVDDIVYNLTNIDDKEITGGFIAAGLYNDNLPIYVRYAYDEEGDQYNLLSQGDWHTVRVGGENVEDGNKVADGSKAADDSWLFKYIRNAATETPDPYDITIFNREGSATSEMHYAFLSHGTDGLALLLTRNNDAFKYEFLSLDDKGTGIENKEISDYATNGFSDDVSKITFDKVEHQFESPKYVIINNNGIEALKVSSSHKEATESASLPDGTRSPLLNDEDYIYYADATYDAETKTYTVSDADRINTLCGLPKANIVYVRYNYNPDTSPQIAADLYKAPEGKEVQRAPLDISGGEWYNITYTDNTDSWWYSNEGTFDSFQPTDEPTDGIYSFQGSTDYLFKLEGGDPYAIRIYNSAKGDMVALNKDGNAIEFSGDTSSSFMLLKKADGSSYLAVTGDYKDNNIKTIKNLNFYQAPTASYYTFHAMRYSDGTFVETWKATLRRNWFMPIRLENDIVRLYALYEKEESTEEDNTNVFDTRDNVGSGRFYADPDMSQSIVVKDDGGNVLMTNVYPAIEEGEDFHIYFKYQVDDENLKNLTSTLEQVNTDVANYLSKEVGGGKLRQGNVNAKWSFMVLDTDEDITTNVDEYGKRTPVGQQYFLYRRDDGKVGWMNNDYALHKDETDNYNFWTYNRLAEWYQQGDNDAFREGRWLWTFIGDDPYNIRLLNLESAVGVTPESEGVYSLPQGEECYTIATEETDSTGKKTYLVSIPMEKPESNDGWGLCPGYGSENTISLQLPMADDFHRPLYWKMATDKAKADSVIGTVKQYDRSNAIQLLRYEPVVYEDVNITIRRADEVDKYKNDKNFELSDMTTGISKLYFAESERGFVAGEKITKQELASRFFNLKRAFCEYTIYGGIFEDEDGVYTVQEGPYPNYNKPKYIESNGVVIDTLRDDDGRIIYEYYDKNGNPADGAQSIYVSYTVTSDIFLPTAPTQDEVAKMVNNNEHVYFMDFPEFKNNQPLAYNTGHHAYFDANATFRDQTGDVTKNGTTEKKKWDSESEKFVNDIEQVYNHCEFKTTTNRMTTAPENLKWYFVGDPYKVQVYSTAGEWGHNDPTNNDSPLVAANLCRFDETETNFQFVVDCVHLRVPDKSNIDNREYIDFYDEYGKPTGKRVYNRGYKRPYNDDFYWEVVPAYSNDKDAFALRFKEDNDLLGYRNVYYYLACDGLTKQYRSSENNKDYNVNLSYEADNEQYQYGDYIGYHTANNESTAIKLTQPVKVYVSAIDKLTYNEVVTKDELSEYYGYGETLKEVPRHLQRKYVTYESNQLPLELSENDDNNKITVTYEVNDTIKKKQGFEQQHLFTSKADFEAGKIQWLDVAVNGKWLYYDKFGGDENKTKLSNYTSVVSGGDGWKDGLKGLHWAFIGDPYDFTIVNRRQYEDKTEGQYLAGNKLTITDYTQTGDSVIWTTNLQKDDAMSEVADHTSKATAKADVNTHWSLQMWKTGGNADFFLRTASLKTGENDYNSDSKDPINQTNNYWRMVAKQYDDSTPVSYFNLVPYSLSDLGSYSNDQSSSNYSQTMNGLGAMQQKIDIRTVTDEDDDDAANDCFDATVSVVSEAGDVRIDQKKDLEISYGDAAEMMPKTLRRYGCDYTCYIGYQGVANPGTPVNVFKRGDFHKEPVDLTYVYHVTDSVGQFFTSSEDAAMDEFIWLFAYFQWMQSYSGTYVEVEKTRKVFDHYVFNAAGEIIDEVYREEKYIEIVPNPSQSFPTSSYLDTHNQQNGVYSDESSQTDDDRLKWSLVGDPYEFTMKNYAQYLENSDAAAVVDESGNVNTSNLEQSTFTIVVGEDGKPYLAVVDPDGTVTLITFDYSSSSDKSLHTASKSGPNTQDPSGNSMNTKDVKEFWMTNLTRYANLVVYHLIMAHQHSDNTDQLTDKQKEEVATHLEEFKKYWGIHLANDPNHYVNDDEGDKTELVKKLLKERGTLRDFLTYPIDDAEASRVGIGTRPLVPWYMKRQFCTYTMYQHDVLEAVPTSDVDHYDENGNPVYKVEWKSIFDESTWADKEKPSGYDEALALQDKPINRLADCHRNRRVDIYLLYEVAPDRFRFATDPATTAWYQMMGGAGSADGSMLMNFSYQKGIDLQKDYTTHYTNDYLWAPQGDPYGFVLHSRYATINGTGWNGVVPTTTTTTGEESLTTTAIFKEENIKQTGDAATNANAVYEMFVGNTATPNAFVMHPTAAGFDDQNADAESKYLVVNSDNKISLASGTLNNLKNNPNANWQLAATAEQLLPYFDRAGYVGGLDPSKAQNFSNVNIRTQLRQYVDVDSKTQPDFTLLSQAQDVVYSGTFSDNGKTFTSANLINMKPGYYRIKAFSEEALSKSERHLPTGTDGETTSGITGPRYISGYRFESEKTDALPLHFFETSMDSATIHTFGEFAEKFGEFAEKLMPKRFYNGEGKSNIELLPADFDPSSIFWFTKSEDANGQYTLQTQGLTVYAKPGDAPAVTTQMGDNTPDGMQGCFTVNDIGGTAMTIRIEADADDKASSLKTNYLDIADYSITCKEGNELNETATGIQTTKWLLQPVGTKEDWPYNEMPLRVEVQQGGVIRDTTDPDPYYYGSLYVPFDTRLGSTIDGAFTATVQPNSGSNLTMPSVSQLNGMGNPQYVPASWPVVLRTSKPVTYKDETYVKNYVNMYLPYDSPRNDVDKEAIKLEGSYLEKELTNVNDGKTIMVFGVPFNGHDHAYNRTQEPFGLYTNDNWWREKYPDADARSATDDKRNNKYVYHNKVYYVLYDKSNQKSRAFVAIFDGDGNDEDIDIDIFDKDTTAPWPCDVYDLQGRRVARNETPETLRKNHPGLPKGVYVFGHKKVVVE